MDRRVDYHGLDILFFMPWELLGQQLELAMSLRVYFTVGSASGHLPPAAAFFWTTHPTFPVFKVMMPVAAFEQYWWEIIALVSNVQIG